jgi:dihydrofolate reductase
VTTAAAPRLVIVAAVADNGVIGQDGDMPWRLSSDLKHFKAITWGRPIVMGRRTFASIGRALPGRDTVVVTRDPQFRADGVTAAPSVEAALAAAARLAAARGADEIMVVGGGELYAALLPCADRLCITEVHALPAGDVVFPPIDRGLFRETARRGPQRGEGDSAPISFVDYERVAAPSEEK